jgi:hypothetical protein
VNERQSPRARQQTRKLPYLTNNDLDAKIDAVTIRVYGTFTKRDSGRKDVCQDDFECDLDVPKGYNMGQVKCAASKYIKKELKGIRLRTFHIDSNEKEKPCDKKYRVRDFISEQGLRDNNSLKIEHDTKLALRRAKEESEDGQFELGAPIDDTNYDANGLPKLTDVYL